LATTETIKAAEIVLSELDEAAASASEFPRIVEHIHEHFVNAETLAGCFAECAGQVDHRTLREVESPKAELVTRIIA